MTNYLEAQQLKATALISCTQILNLAEVRSSSRPCSILLLACPQWPPVQPAAPVEHKNTGRQDKHPGPLKTSVCIMSAHTPLAKEVTLPSSKSTRQKNCITSPTPEGKNEGKFLLKTTPICHLKCIKLSNRLWKYQNE